MSLQDVLEGKESSVEEENEGEEEEEEILAGEFGEGEEIPDAGGEGEEVSIEEGHKEYVNAGEYGEGVPFYIYRPAGEGSIWEESVVSSVESAAESEVEETEEEKELRKEREMLIENVKQKILERIFLKTRNSYLQKKLAQHFKKRRMENVFKGDPKGLDLEKKYLRRLYAFQEFKQMQEDEVENLTVSLEKFQLETDRIEEELQEKLINFTNRAKEVSLNLILSKSGKKLSEKEMFRRFEICDLSATLTDKAGIEDDDDRVVDRLLRRQLKKNEEKGKRKLKNIKIKNLIEEKEKQLKEMECIGDGLYTGDYEQMKIDNQNLWDKIEEKEEELTKMREKTQTIMQYLSQVKETSHALEGDIELMSEKVYDVEKRFAEMRKRLTEARKKRDVLREDLVRLKSTSGLLTKDALLRDFEVSMFYARTLNKKLDEMKKQMQEKKKEEVRMTQEMSSKVDILSGKTRRLSVPGMLKTSRIDIHL